MSIEERALSIPDPLIEQDGENNVELARIWWAGSGPMMNIRPALEDPFYIGVILAEAAFHFSQAYEASNQGNQPEVLERILAGWTSANDQAAAKLEEAANDLGASE